MKNKLDDAYLDLVEDILKNGIQKSSRAGDTISVFGRTIRHDMRTGFPVLTTKKMHWKSIVTELLWFLNGETNIKFLLDRDCHIWDGDAFKNYYDKSHEFRGDWPDTKEEFIEKIKTDPAFATRWGDLGPIYGKQWRKWQDWITYRSKATGELNAGSIWHDQIGTLLHQLKTNPDSRRLMVNAWNVNDVDKAVLPPCHYGFQCWTRELDLGERNEIASTMQFRPHEVGHNAFDEFGIPKRSISLLWNQRSVDTALGLPFNIASYGLLLEIIGKTVNMVPEQLIGSLGDCHLYTNQIDGIKEQLKRTPYELPKLTFGPIFLANLEHKDFDTAISGQATFDLEGYQYHPTIKIPLSN